MWSVKRGHHHQRCLPRHHCGQGEGQHCRSGGSCLLVSQHPENGPWHSLRGHPVKLGPVPKVSRDQALPRRLHGPSQRQRTSGVSSSFASKSLINLMLAIGFCALLQRPSSVWHVQVVWPLLIILEFRTRRGAISLYLEAIAFHGLVQASGRQPARHLPRFAGCCFDEVYEPAQPEPP